MGFSIYHKNLDVDMKADEIIFKLTPNSDLVSFVEYIKNISDKKIVLQYENADAFSKNEEIAVENFIKAVHLEFNISVAISRAPQIFPLKTFLKEQNYSFFYYEPLYNLMELFNAIEEGVNEVCVHGTLAFQLKSLSKIRNRGIKIRVFVDSPIMLSYDEFNLTQIVPERTFWIRPEDINIYSKYVDTFEILYVPQVKLDIYKKGIWEGKVSDLIPAVKLDVFNNTIPPIFANIRINCGWECGLNKCGVCKQCMLFAKQLSENHLKLKVDKNDQ